MLTMKFGSKEDAIKVAAAWWADRLRREPHARVRGVMPETNMLRSLLLEVTKRPVDRQVDMFQVKLEEIIRERIIDSEWKPDIPEWCSAFRIISTDWNPDIYLGEALKFAGISEALLPPKTLMWINPDGVKVNFMGRIHSVCEVES